MSMRLLRGMAVALLIALAACGNDQPDLGKDDQRYEANATVLEAGDEGPQLCLGAVLTSSPPQCGGPVITNWDWDRIDRFKEEGDTIWGEYHVVGTFDGTSFTLTEDPGPYERTEPEDRIFTPCEPPRGGWDSPDPERTGEGPLQAAGKAARRSPDFAGFWIDDPNPRSGETQDLTKVILNAAFTTDPARHEVGLRKYWGGPMCITKVARTLAELERIRAEVEKDPDLKMLSSDADEVQNVVRLEVEVVPAGKQAQFDAHYGAGVVKLEGALKPV